MLFPLHWLFLFTLMLGSFIAINATSWLVAWVGLEVNLLSILPIMAGESTKGSSESCMKYFLVQSMASLLILISSVFILSTLLFSSLSIILIGLSIKLGVAPFHYWFPTVMEGVGWLNCLILMTWQKLAPLFLLSFTEIMLVFIILSSLVGSIGGFGQFSVKSILAFSSINHLGWMLAGMLWGVKVSLCYFLVYFLMSFMIVMFFYYYKLFYVSQFGNLAYALKIVTLVNFLSLGGMPPFLGFFPKWLVIDKLLWASFFLSLILIFSSLVSLYFYLRLVYPSLLLSFVGSEILLGGTSGAPQMVLFSFFFSSGGFFLYPLLSSV